MFSIDNAQNEIGLPGHIDDGREWTEWLLRKAGEQKQAIEPSNFLTVPRSTVLKKELEQIEQRLNTLQTEWKKKSELMNLVYELEACLLTGYGHE
ncbi:hypothetical protein PSI23_16735 [Xenorhabdus sp. XENO-10]|uniref:Transposase n=1 Tax=Xenorhabdus yunnanensis TaxID=3025878 RepID=A0ABT5LIF0_9GAMM|nr:hypothetical protein [Xenorhabdus yunnanensis]MDC9590882.1 hypothetical protein [Xenorhabdus yunnanensis]